MPYTIDALPMFGPAKLAQADGLGEIGLGDPAALLHHDAVGPWHHAAEGARADGEEAEEELAERFRRRDVQELLPDDVICRRFYTSGMRRLLGLALAGLCFPVQAQQPLPIFDAHVHYSHDAWDVVPVQEAISIMRRAGVKRALISSSGDDGQQRLYAAAPDPIPELRPYRSRGEIGTWVRDETLIPIWRTD